jgi:FkbM family methyltransferase
VAWLRKNLALNTMGNVEVVEAAAASQSGSATFTGNAFMGRMAPNGERSVRTTRLDDYPTPDLIKMDIEGAEVEALRGAERTLAERRTVWFIETHGWPAAEDCKAILAAHGYSMTSIGDHHIFAVPDAGSFRTA